MFNLNIDLKLNNRLIALIIGAFIGTLIPNILFSTYTNVRYFMQSLPFLLLLFYISLVYLIHNYKLRVFVLILVSFLFVLSCFFTIDPISKKIFGTFKFGIHDMLNMTSITKECCGYGRDQLVYNLQYANLHYIQKYVFSALKPDSNTSITFNSMAAFHMVQQLNNKTYQRTSSKSDIIYANYIYLDHLNYLSSLPTELYYLAFPNFDNEAILELLKSQYKVADFQVFEHLGYTLPVYKFVKINSYL